MKTNTPNMHIIKKTSFSGLIFLVMLTTYNISYSQISFQEHLIIKDISYIDDVYACDLDGDSDLDIVIAHDDHVSWMENLDGQGNFGDLVNITDTVDNAESVFAIDIDGDGDLDVLSASEYDNKIAWYQNDGNGNFGAQQIISTNANHARSVYAVDIDKDGNNDVLSASLSDNKIAWYQNNGTGDFSTPKIISASASGAEAVFAADLNNDSHIDVLSASYFDDKIAWYQNDGSGNFGTQQIINITDGAIDVYAADIDGDNYMDVLSASVDAHKVAWYQNDGTGVFSAEQIIDTLITGCYSVFVADLDNDGDKDVLYGTDGKIICKTNTDGTGNFGAQQIIKEPTFGVNKGLSAVDINNDNKLDILAVSANKIIWFENYLELSSVHENSSLSFSLFPNPVESSLHVVAKEIIDRVEVYNSLGQLVLEDTPCSNRFILNTSQLNEVFFIIKVYAGAMYGSYHFLKE